MKSKSNLIIYAAAVFVVFMVITWILRLLTDKLPIEDGIWGVYKNSDFFLGIVVAGIITLSHYQKRKLK
ncbi:MAG: hypothetical protein GX102_06090 [Porphyromonadaceae bacterium]|nr:hypothetical protein [Porphyromonadaceae bacterium]